MKRTRIATMGFRADFKLLFKRILLFFVLNVSLLEGILVAQENEVTSVEGIFYLDNTPVVVEIDRGVIRKIVRNRQSDASKGKWIVAPGLIDNQINGCLSVGFATPDLTVEGVRKVARALWKTGVTTFLPTLVTNSHDRFMENLTVLAKAIQEPDLARSIPGFHLEGPYISAVDGFRGSHPKPWVRPPDWKEFLEWNRAAGGNILQITLAPETEGAMDFIRNCASQGIVVGLGHHNGTASQITQAVDCGAAISTHLGNGCANTIHRHDNPLWPQLAEDRLLASIIVDGFHLRPEEVQVFFKTKTVERLVLTSDMAEMAGMPPGQYIQNEQTVTITPEGMIQVASQNVLAGASMPLNRGVANIMNYTGCSLADAIHMASRNPARLYRLEDRGEIQSGKRADLVLFSMDGEGIHIRQTVVAGKVVFSSDTK